MYHNFVPTNLHGNADRLIADLTALRQQPTACPYCQHNELYAVNASSGYYRCKSCKRGFNRSLNTPFYRLAPLELFPIIAERRLCGHGYAAIRHELNCTSWIIKRRTQVIEQYMQTHYPKLYEWYQNFIDDAESEVPKVVKLQTEQLKNWLNDVLFATSATCPHCASTNCQKVGDKRAQFRCKTCWRYFSNLKGTKLAHLGRSENWIAMIDMLVLGKTNYEIEHTLNISSGTVTKAKRNWIEIMQQQNLQVLKEWVITK